ncbi:MAG TPA: C4-dicarboxylate ABC transporter substrate-binding protein, partial [Thalassospira sp.]|nr:C4-dicarboxylate ABC transporter substrate-binding protein [Thalassospira sp.]
MTKSLKSLAGATFIATLIAAAPFAANAQEFTLKIQSSDAAGVPNFE